MSEENARPAATPTAETVETGSGDDRGVVVKKRIWLAVKIAGTVVGLAWVFSITDLSDVGGSLSRVPLVMVGAAIALTAINVAVGTVRWRLLLITYGSEHPPSHVRLFLLYLVGLFYNAYLPGGVGGDVVRGVVTKEAFGGEGVTPALTVVFVERVLGLSGLLSVVALAFLIHPLPGMEGALPYTALGLAAGAGVVVSVAIGRRIGPKIPGPPGRVLARLPAMRWPVGLFICYALSLVTQSLVALSGWVLLEGAVPGTGVLAAFVIVPTAMATVYLPITVGGAGAREAAFVVLCTQALSMTEADALAVSLLLWFSQLVVAGSGGIIQLVSPLSAAEKG